MVSSFPGVMYGPLFYRQLELDKVMALRASKNSTGRMCKGLLGYYSAHKTGRSLTLLNDLALLFPIAHETSCTLNFQIATIQRTQNFGFILEELGAKLKRWGKLEIENLLPLRPKLRRGHCSPCIN